MGAIINIFKSIIGLVTGLFSKKNKDGFYMEASPAPAGTVAPAKVAPAAVPAKAAAPAVKKGGVPQKAAAAAAVAVATAVTAAPKTVDAADLIRAAVTAKAPAAADSATAPGAPTFAELNAVPISSGNRRRPGANMTGFLDMAKTMRKR